METDEIVVEIITRLPLRSIARFKSVCKQWRSLIESPYFRRLFISLHRSSSSSWSLIFQNAFLRKYVMEAISFHGCERWALSKSPASYVFPFRWYLNLPTLQYYYVDSSNGLIWIEINFGAQTISFVGNPISQEWVEIPPPPQDRGIRNSSLVTRVDNGVVSSFKAVWTFQKIVEPRERTFVWEVYVYSSETGTWTFKRLWSSLPLQISGHCRPLYRPLGLNGMVYLWEKRVDDDTGPGVLVSYDFYGENDDGQCRIIPLPVPYCGYVRRCLTTSGGDVIYVEILDRILKVWKLKNNNNSDGEWWQLTRGEIDMGFVGFKSCCLPLGVNPFDSDLVYLWSQRHSCVVSGNLRTQNFIVHKKKETWSDGEGCWRVNSSDSKKLIEKTRGLSDVIALSQFVLPQWMDPVPRPPN